MRRSSLAIGLAITAACRNPVGSLGVIDDTQLDLTGDSGKVEDSGAPADSGTIQDTGAPADDTAPPVDTAPDYSMYDGAQLIVHKPRSATIYLLGGGLPYKASIVDANGQPLPFQDVTWTATPSKIAPFTGLDTLIERPTLEPGVYSINVDAQLPNGDHLAQTLQQVRVQTRLTGLWVGDVHLAVSTTYNNVPLQADCIGAITFEVPLDGTELSGDGGCTVVLGALGQLTFDVDIEADVDDPLATGTVAVGFTLVKVGMSLENSGFHGRRAEFQGSFSGDISNIHVEGTVNTSLATQWIKP